MKKVTLFSIATIAILMNGCSAMDGVYGAGKGVYGAGKVVAKKAIEIGVVDSETLETLKTIDKGATAYDETRAVIREGNE